MKKKAIAFEFGMIIAVAILMLATLIVLLPKSQISKEYKIGNIQSTQLKTYVEAEKLRFYVKESAKLAMQQGIFEQASKSGFPAEKDCNRYYGLVIWNDKDKKCMPEAPEKELDAFFKKNLNEFLKNYPTMILTADYFPTLFITSAENQVEIKGTTGDKAVGFSLDIYATEKGKVVERDEVITTQILREEDQQCDIAEIVNIPTTITCKTRPCQAHKDIIPFIERADELIREEGSRQGKEFTMIVTEGYRSYAEQEKKYIESGRDKASVAAPSCVAPHTTGKSVDIKIDGWEELGPSGFQYSYQRHRFTTNQLNEHKKLRELMGSIGLVGYQNEQQTEGEWWHFECCNTIRYELAQNSGTNYYGGIPT